MRGFGLESNSRRESGQIGLAIFTPTIVCLSAKKTLETWEMPRTRVGRDNPGVHDDVADDPSW